MKCQFSNFLIIILATKGSRLRIRSRPGVPSRTPGGEGSEFPSISSTENAAGLVIRQGGVDKGSGLAIVAVEGDLIRTRTAEGRAGQRRAGSTSKLTPKASCRGPPMRNAEGTCQELQMSAQRRFHGSQEFDRGPSTHATLTGVADEAETQVYREAHQGAARSNPARSRRYLGILFQKRPLIRSYRSVPRE